MSKQRVFLLSPANSSGRRAGYLLNPRGQSELAKRLQAGQTVPLGELFAFMSKLYFRGKLAYAMKFAQPPPEVPGVLVITGNRGLIPADQPFAIEDLRGLTQAAIDHRDQDYRQSLLNSGLRLAVRIGPSCDVVLLGSIASQKYVEVLLECFGPQLLFPSDFVGRGDMSRGGLLLRCVASGEELDYMPVAGAVRRGARPAKLAPLPRGARQQEVI